jgi:hypothetical protein
MTRRIVLITQDIEFDNFIKITALTLTKLNYQVDIFRELRKDIDLVIIDFDSPESIKTVKSIRSNPELKNKKIVGVASVLTDKKVFFVCGCDSVMSKKEFEPAANSILMY